MKELAGLKALTHLQLLRTKVTDAGLKELAKLKDLKDLDVGETKVTDKGVIALEKSLPECQVMR